MRLWSKLYASAATTSTLGADKVSVSKLSNFERNVFRWFGNSKYRNLQTTEIPLFMLDKAKSKFWIYINVGTIVASSILVVGSVYRQKHREDGDN